MEQTLIPTVVPPIILQVPPPAPHLLIPYILPADIEWSSLLKETQKVAKPRCGRPVKGGDLCFKCLDCTPNKFDHILCEKCFRKGNHKNHRIKYKNDTYGWCDCGDEGYILPKAFCEDHQQKTLDYKEIKAKIPKNFKENAKNLLSSIFFEALKKIEEFNKNSNNSHWDETLPEFITTHKLLTFFVEFILWIVEDNLCFLIFFSDFLRKKGKKFKTQTGFYHKCADLEKLTYEDLAKPCNCSIVELIFRFNYFLSEELKEKLVSMIFKLSPSSKLSNFTLLQMKNYINFIICPIEKRSPLIEINDSDEEKTDIHYYYSVFMKFYLYLNSNAEIVITFFKENNQILLRKFQQLLDILPGSSTNKTKTAIDKLLHFYISRIMRFRGSVYEIMGKKHLFSDIFNVFISIKKLKVHGGLDESINVLEVLCEVLNMTRRMLKKALEKRKIDENIEKTVEKNENFLEESFFENIKKIENFKKIEEFIKNNKNHDLMENLDFGRKVFLDISEKLTEIATIEIEELREILKKEDYIKFVHFCGIASKFFSVFLSFFLNCFDYDFDQTVIFLQDFIEKTLFDMIFEVVLLSLYIDFLVQEGNFESKKQEFHIYSISGTFFKAYDVFALKFFFFNKKFQLNIGKIMKILDINENFHVNSNENQSTSMMKFILNLANIILFDDLSTINLMNMTNNRKSKNIKERVNIRNSLNFVLANLFLINPHFKFENLKKIINVKEKELDEIIQEIADFNEKSQNFELKEEFRNKFDIFSFYEGSMFYGEYIERVKTLCHINKNLDFFIGNWPIKLVKEKSELFLKPLKTSQLFDVIVHTFLNEENEDFLKDKGILRISIKLMSFIVEMCMENKDFTMFLERKQEFFSRTQSLLKKNLKEYEGSIILIQKRLEEMSKNEKKMEIEEIASLDENMKNINAKRKLKIMEEFDLKQKKFISKNKSIEHQINKTSKESMKNEKKIENCFSCFQSIEKDCDVLNYICYISKHKNQSFFDKKDDFVSFYIFSCGHLIHKNCQENQRKFEKSNFNKFFFSNSESVCTYCKSLSNILVPIIEHYCVRKNDINEFFLYKEDLEKPKPIEYLIDFMKKCENLEKFENFVKFRKFANFNKNQNLIENFEEFENFKDEFHKFANFKKNLEISPDFLFNNKKAETYFKDFYDELIIATCFDEESKQNLCITRYFDEILMNLFENLYTKNLTNFIQFSSILSNNMFLLFSYYVRNLDSPSKSEFFHDFKEKLSIDLQFLSKMLKIDDFIEIYTSNFHLILIKSLVRISVLFVNHEEILIPLLQNIIKVFINQMFIISSMAFSEVQNCDFEKILVFFKNFDLKSKVMGFLSPYYFLIIGILLTFFKYDKFELYIENFLNFDHDIENSQLFKAFEEYLAPDPIYMKFLWENSNLNKKQEFQQKAEFSEKFNIFKQKFFKLNNYEIPWLSTITTYDDFVIKFMSQTCEICEFYPHIPKNDLYLCLFCSRVFCNGICEKIVKNEKMEIIEKNEKNEKIDKDDDFKKFKKMFFKNKKRIDENDGNLTAHVKNEHVGNGVFINLLKGSVLLFNGVSVLLMNSIFSSKFGKVFGEYSYDLKNYFIDKKTLTNLSNAFFNKRFPQEFFHLSLNEKNIYFNAPKWEKL